MRTRLTAVVGLIAVIALGAITLGTILDWLWQGHLVRRSVSIIRRNYPVGIQLVDARVLVRKDYPSRFNERTAETCVFYSALTTSCAISRPFLCTHSCDPLRTLDDSFTQTRGVDRMSPSKSMSDCCRS